MKTVIIRNETPADYPAVEHLTREAFWNQYVPGCSEHCLVHVMRSHPDYIPQLAFVLELEGRIIGSIQTSAKSKIRIIEPQFFVAPKTGGNRNCIQFDIFPMCMDI